MSRMLISSGGPWERQVGYSRAVRVGQHVFVSGSTGMHEGTLVGIGDPAAQAQRALDTISEALKQAGAGLADVVRYRIFVTQIDDWPKIAPVLSAAFADIRPAATRLEVKGFIDPDMLVEIEVDAIICEPDGA